LIILAIGLIRIKRENKKEIGTAEEKEEEEASNSMTFQLILSWNEMLKAIDWNIIFLFGGGLVFGSWNRK
jgi:hypothetical protein